MRGEMFQHGFSGYYRPLLAFGLFCHKCPLMPPFARTANAYRL
jgi:hypothetical protein